MKVCSIAALFCSFVLLSSSIARSDDTPTVKEILEKADAAAKAVKGVAYDGEFHGEGSLAKRPKLAGTVKAARGRKGLLGTLFGGSGSNPVHITGKITYPGKNKTDDFDVALDGKNVTVIDNEKKTYSVGGQGFSTLGQVMSLLMLEYVHPTPFSDEIEAKSAKLEGEKKIGDADCYIIYVVYQNNTETRWFFDKKDHLPRQCERIIKDSTGGGKTVITVKNLVVDPQFQQDTFAPRPAGYKLEEPLPVSDPSLIAVGMNAPNWTLKTPEGKEVELKSLRGNVVVMDFWATWCGPCKMAMPGIQKLHEKYKDKSVKVFGVSCRERPGGNPTAFMKSKQYSYGLLLDGTDVAEKYLVEGIPTFYVIDQEGKVAFASSGYNTGGDEQLGTIIETLLKKTED